MQDVLTSVVSSLDAQSQPLSCDRLSELANYFSQGRLRTRAAALISQNAALIVQEAVNQTFAASDGRSANRRYAACIRDLDYYLRYATYAMLAGDVSVLEERVLDGLQETYQALGVSIDSTITAIQTMKRVTVELVGREAGEEIGSYFDYLCAGLS